MLKPKLPPVILRSEFLSNLNIMLWLNLLKTKIHRTGKFFYIILLLAFFEWQYLPKEKLNLSPIAQKAILQVK